MFTGDIVRLTMVAISGASYKGNLEAIDRTLKTSTQLYIPAHGTAGDRKIVLAYRNFVDTLRSTVARYYDAGMTDYQIKPPFMNALTEYRGWSRFTPGQPGLSMKCSKTRLNGAAKSIGVILAGSLRNLLHPPSKLLSALQ
jgi:hypothetical protein